MKYKHVLLIFILLAFKSILTACSSEPPVLTNDEVQIGIDAEESGEIEHVSVTYQTHMVLRDISLEIPPDWRYVYNNRFDREGVIFYPPEANPDRRAHTRVEIRWKTYPDFGYWSYHSGNWSMEQIVQHFIESGRIATTLGGATAFTFEGIHATDVFAEPGSLGQHFDVFWGGILYDIRILKGSCCSTEWDVLEAIRDSIIFHGDMGHDFEGVGKIEVEEDTFQALDRDYIVVTNADGSLEPQKLRVGDEFLGLKLVDISGLNALVYEENDIQRVSVLSMFANFEGNLVLRGNIEFFRNELFDVALFHVNEKYLNLVPSHIRQYEIDNLTLHYLNPYPRRIFIENRDYLEELLGVEIPLFEEVSEFNIFYNDVQIIIKDYVLVEWDSSGWDRAILVHLESHAMG